MPSIDRTTFQPFLCRKFTDGKRLISIEISDAIFELEITGDKQQLCSALWQSSKAGETIETKTLDIAHQRIFGQEIEDFCNILGHLPALQLRVLKAIAMHGTNNMMRFLEPDKCLQLIDKWILVEDHKEIYFNNPFLRFFVQKQLPQLP